MVQLPTALQLATQVEAAAYIGASDQDVDGIHVEHIGKNLERIGQTSRVGRVENDFTPTGKPFSLKPYSR